MAAKKPAKRRNKGSPRPKPPSASRARPRAKSNQRATRGGTVSEVTADVDQAIAEIVDLMARGLYFPGKTERDIAQKYGRTVNTAHDWAAQASRFMRLSLPKEDLLAIFIAECNAARDLAVNRSRVERRALKGKDGKRTGKYETVSVPDPDIKGFLRSIELKGKFLGLFKETVRIETPGAGKATELEERSTEELEYYAEHGRWPGDGRRQELTPAPANPLEKLH